MKSSDVEQMTQRMEGHDLSLDAPIGDEGESTHVESLAGQGPSQEYELSSAQEQTMVQGRIGKALARLDQRERYIIEQRVMSDRPVTLKEVGEHFGFSRERARQLEMRAKDKLKQELHALATEIEWPTEGQLVEVDDHALV